VDAQFRDHRRLGCQCLVRYLASRSVGHVKMVCSMPCHKLVASDAVQQSMHSRPLRCDRLQRLRKKSAKVPKGRLNLAQDGILGGVQQSGSVPQGRLKAARNIELAEFQPSLRDYSSSINLPRITSWAKFSRPFGTFSDFFRSLCSPHVGGFQ
jgi:hypothetical protein